MDKKNEIIKIYREVFRDPLEYVEMYFSRVYREEEAMTLEVDGLCVSSLFLQRRVMDFYGEPVQLGYIAAAATRKQYRDRGYMHELLVDSLCKSYSRGDMFLSLIPANRELYFYYDRLDFATVFYIEEQHYTALHQFHYTGDYTDVEDMESEEVYEAFNRMMSLRKNSVMHSYNDYLNILADNRVDRGRAIAVRNVEGEIAAIGFGVMRDDNLVVRELLFDSYDSRNALLDRLQGLFPHVAITVIAVPEDNGTRSIESRGMGRIINAKGMFDSLARSFPQLKMTIKLTDPLLQVNSHIYFIDRGMCTVNDGFRGKIDLDVDIKTMTSIIFSDGKIGSIFNLETHRPFISLMLD